MSRYHRENPDAQIIHDWLEGVQHVKADPAKGKDSDPDHIADTSKKVDTDLSCSCHERDGSHVCEFCKSLGYRGHCE